MNAYFAMRVTQMNKLQIIFIQLHKHVNIYFGQVMKRESQNLILLKSGGKGVNRNISSMHSGGVCL